MLRDLLRDLRHLAPVLSATAVLDGCSVNQWNQAPQPAIMNPNDKALLENNPSDFIAMNSSDSIDLFEPLYNILS